MNPDHVTFLAAVLAGTSDGVLAFDADFRYTAWNGAMERISGLRSEDVLGKHAFSLFPFLLETGEDEYFRRALRGESGVSRAARYAVPETGREGFFEGRYAPLRDASGAVIGGVAFIRDVTAELSLKARDESLKLHYRVLQSMREGVSVSDEAGVIVYTNPAEDAMFGYPPGGLIGQHVTVQNAYPAEENTRIVAEVIETLKRDGTWVGEWRNRRRDGSSFTTRAQITRVDSEEGDYFVCVQEDVTKESQANAEQRQITERLALALEASKLGMWQWDAASDVVTFDPRAAEIFGIPSGPHMTWTRMRELLHPHDRERARAAVEAAIASRSDYDVEYRVLHPNGDERWVAARGRAFHAADGAPESMLGVVQDVTARKHAEQALVDETRAVETINDVGAVLAAELDQQKLLQALTDAATRISDAQFGSYFYNVVDEKGESYMLYILSGVPPDAFAGFPMPRNTPIFEPTFRGEGVVRIDDVTRDRRYGTMPPHHGMPAGHLPVRSYLAVPVVSRTGEVLGGLFFGHANPGVFTARHERMVTGIATQAGIALDNARLYRQAREAERQARERSEQLAEADRRKDEFLAVLAHELRNPLGAISNALHVMGLVPADAPAFARAREAALRQAGLQKRLVDDLLDVSRIARGKIRLQLESLDLAALAREVAADHETVFRDAGLHLDVRVPEVPVHVDGDRARLAQVLANLLDNACKFTPDGGEVRVIVRGDDGFATMEVRDTGVGVDEGLLPQLFRLFAQADRTIDRSRGGLGLGLALVKGLVELHPGGMVEATSKGPHQGTSITVRLRTASEVRRKDPEAPVALSRPLRVLVVDDIHDVADTLAALLAAYGCETRVVYSGSAAMEVATEFQPHAVLCDIGLPGGVTGYDVARGLRGGVVPAGTVVVALTGYGAEQDQRRSREAGFDDHLTKPVQPEQLVSVLNLAVARLPVG